MTVAARCYTEGFAFSVPKS